MFRLQAARRSHPGMDSPEGVAFRERLLAAAGAFLRVRAPAVNAQLCQVCPPTLQQPFGPPSPAQCISNDADAGAEPG